MNDLQRSLAPISDGAWAAIDDEARTALRVYLSARKLVDFHGPLGWQTAALPSGRSRRLSNPPGTEVDASLRQVQPLLELRVPFELPRTELDAIDRGASAPDLDGVRVAARRLADAEDQVVYYGHAEAGVQGIAAASEHQPIVLSDDYTAYPHSVATAVRVLRESGVEGPWAIALGPRCYTGLTTTVTPSGFPVLEHVRRVLGNGPLIWAPSVDGALVLSLRGGDFELAIGRDISVGYHDHDADRVRLYLEESLTFRLLGAEAAVPLVYGS